MSKEIEHECTAPWEKENCIDKHTCPKDTLYEVCPYWKPKKRTEGPSTEEAIAKFDTLQKIVAQLEWCGYECEAGSLNNNVAFLALKRMAGEAKSWR